MVDNNKYPCSKTVVEYYKSYSSKKTIKDTTIHGAVFTIDDRYKILEKSDIICLNYIIFLNSRIRSIWYRSSGY